MISFLMKIMKGYCRRDFKMLKISIQKPRLDHLPEKQHYIFIRFNPQEENEEEIKFYFNAGIVDGPIKFTTDLTLRGLRMRIRDFIKDYPVAAEKYSYLE